MSSIYRCTPTITTTVDTAYAVEWSGMGEGCPLVGNIGGWWMIYILFVYAGVAPSLQLRHTATSVHISCQ
jgi:hypothetical protein